VKFTAFSSIESFRLYLQKTYNLLQQILINEKSNSETVNNTDSSSLDSLCYSGLKRVICPCNTVFFHLTSELWHATLIHAYTTVHRASHKTSLKTDRETGRQREGERQWPTDSVESMVDEMLEVLAHANLPHQLVLVAVHSRQLADVRKDVLKSIRQLQVHKHSHTLNTSQQHGSVCLSVAAIFSCDKLYL